LFLQVIVRKSPFTKSITSKITIDGKIEGVWAADIETASNFVMFEPDNGKPISEDKKTEKVLYDNDALLYFSPII
jgi:hypothetical protein